ncbi:uncharacterized protein MONBRDRAFT_33823 [Monosiga brevicollis MX1]|uniref:Protein kinase domain-containing protein n=1 Tax=Monosiga brevicollis TaxID=81824 RepID=A9V7S2_MONBE|nr:uncharacterized protein MONBRDRAFT_33823 [Monosiga brevicollis MX1]EDQ86424.1 predicted protein [Monosiga brevicollis MX1]|eukprot:XP_001748814.1 hypothetical protein [Monosiga brevicollis MX1]
MVMMRMMMRWVVCGVVLVLIQAVTHHVAMAGPTPTDDPVLYSGTVGCSLDVPTNVTHVLGNITLSVCGSLTARRLSVFDKLVEVSGNLKIENNIALTNLDGLRSLRSIGGYLNIRNNEALTNVDGLGSLTIVGGYVDLRSIGALTNVDGLGNLTSVGDSLSVLYNRALTNVDGLGHLTSVGGSLDVRINEALTNVDGLGSLTRVGDNLHVQFNPVLTNGDGLRSLTSIGGSLDVKYNNALTNLDGLGSLTSVGGSLDGKYDDSLTSIPYNVWWRGLAYSEPGYTEMTVATSYIQCASNRSPDALDMIKCKCFDPPYEDAPFCPKPAQNVVCSSTGSVLDIVQVCDGVDDCPNGEDEASCRGVLGLRSVSHDLPSFLDRDCISQIELWVQHGVIQSVVPQGAGNHSCLSWRGAVRNWDAAELYFALGSARMLVTERPRPWVVMAVTLRSISPLSEEVPLRAGYQLIEGALFGLKSNGVPFGAAPTLPSLAGFDTQYTTQVDGVIPTTTAATMTTLAALTSESKGSSANASSMIVVVAVATSITLLAVVAAIAYTMFRRTRRRIERTAMESQVLTLMHQARANFAAAYPHLHSMPLELVDSDAVTVEQVIGHGHFSNVYRASLVDAEQGSRHVAIKECDADKTTLSAWLREIMLLHSVRDQPNIIGLHGVMLRVAERSNVSAVLEWAPHGNLRDFVRRSPLSEAQLYQALRQMVKALAYLAKLEIVHRDIAARNVLVMAVNPAFNCKLGDFGCQLRTALLVCLFVSRVMPSSEYYRSVADSEMPFRYDVPSSRGTWQPWLRAAFKPLQNPDLRLPSCSSCSSCFRPNTAPPPGSLSLSLSLKLSLKLSLSKALSKALSLSLSLSSVAALRDMDASALSDFLTSDDLKTLSLDPKTMKPESDDFNRLDLDKAGPALTYIFSNAVKAKLASAHAHARVSDTRGRHNKAYTCAVSTSSKPCYTSKFGSVGACTAPGRSDEYDTPAQAMAGAEHLMMTKIKKGYKIDHMPGIRGVQHAHSRRLVQANDPSGEPLPKYRKLAPEQLLPLDERFQVPAEKLKADELKERLAAAFLPTEGTVNVLRIRYMLHLGTQPVFGFQPFTFINCEYVPSEQLASPFIAPAALLLPADVAKVQAMLNDWQAADIAPILATEEAAKGIIDHAYTTAEYLELHLAALKVFIDRAVERQTALITYLN